MDMQLKASSIQNERLVKRKPQKRAHCILRLVLDALLGGGESLDDDSRIGADESGDECFVTTYSRLYYTTSTLFSRFRP